MVLMRITSIKDVMFFMYLFCLPVVYCNTKINEQVIGEFYKDRTYEGRSKHIFGKGPVIFWTQNILKFSKTLLIYFKLLCISG